MRESAIQSAILKYLRYHPKVAWVERMNVGATKVGNRFIRFGKPGMCDITGQLKNGRRLEIELARQNLPRPLEPRPVRTRVEIHL